MPANLTPQYHKAEEVFKQARTSEEKIVALEEMLRLMPKHKGTDHLQADLKRKLSKLREEDARPKGKKVAFDPFRVDKGGAGQVLLLGAPNAGKSALVSRLTSAQTEPTPFPFATQGPIPGMMSFEEVQVQLVDLPPITADYLPTGMLGLVKSTDGALLVADLSQDTVLEDVDTILGKLAEGRVQLFDPEVGSAGGVDGEVDNLVTRIPTLMVANKVDAAGAADRLALLRELHQGRFALVEVSAESGQGLDTFPGAVFRMLRCIRIYSKEPGKAVDRSSPFVLKEGQTVLDLAAKIHRDFPDHLKQARVWGSARFDGQAVQRDHVLQDKDVVELQVDL